MKFKTVFKTMTLAVACLSAVVFASCGDDDDDNKSMKFSASKVEIGVDSIQAVGVANCTTPLTATSSDTKIATVTVDKTTLTIKGVKAGSATVMVTDANKQTGTVSVTVKNMLSFDKSSVAVAVGKKEIVNVKSGTAPYTVSVKDNTVAKAAIKDAAITISGLKAGTTTVTVTDKNKVTGTFKVTVSK